MARKFQHVCLTLVLCQGLREAIRPLIGSSHSIPLTVDFCKRLYLAFYSLDADPELTTVAFPLNEEEIMLINNFVSAEDGDWAKDILHQTRQVLYELTTQKNAMKLAFSSDVKKLFPEESVPTKSEAELTDSTLEDKLKGEET